MSDHAQISAAGGVPPAERQARQNGKDAVTIGGFPFQSLLNAGTAGNTSSNFALRANQQIVLNLTSELPTGLDTRREPRPSVADAIPQSPRFEDQASKKSSGPIDEVENAPDADNFDDDQAMPVLASTSSQSPPQDADNVSSSGERTNARDGSASSRGALPPEDTPNLNTNRFTEHPAERPGISGTSSASELSAKNDPSRMAGQAATTQTPSIRLADAEQALSQANRTPVHISVVDNTSRLNSGPSAALLRSTDMASQAGANAVTAASASEGQSGGQNGAQTGGQNAGTGNNSQQGLMFGENAAAQAARAGLANATSGAAGEAKGGFAPVIFSPISGQSTSLQNSNLTGFNPSTATPFSTGTHGTVPAGASRATASAAAPVRAAPHEIGVQITRAAKAGIDRIAIDLKPETLGRIEVRLDLGQDSRVSALFLADSRETLEMLRAEARVLHQNLQDAGLKTDPHDLQFDLRGEHGEPRRDNSSTPDAGSDRLAAGADVSAEELSGLGARYAAGYTPVLSDTQVDVLA